MSAPRREILADGVEIWLGDCREIMPRLEPVDLLCTDPPYLLTSGGDTNGAIWKKGRFAGEDYKNDGAIVATIPWDSWLPIAFGACAKDSDAYIMANDKSLLDAMRETVAAGWAIHNVLVWNKENGTPNRWYFKDCEFTVYAWRGKARTINNPTSCQLLRVPRDPKAGHPTQKPVGLMAHYIGNSSQPGGRVLDPFLGSGSTGVAAVRLGRRFVGIEIEPRFFEIARRRISEALKAPSLFVADRRPEVVQHGFDL